MSIQVFKELLGKKPIIASGSIAMELSLRDKHDIPADIWNLKDPVTIESIYRDFVDAGATVLGGCCRVSAGDIAEAFALARALQLV